MKNPELSRRILFVVRAESKFNPIFKNSRSAFLCQDETRRIIIIHVDDKQW